MAKSPTDENQPDADIASEVKSLREAIIQLRATFEGQVKELSAKADQAAAVSEAAAKEAASAVAKIGAVEATAATAEKRANAAEAAAAAADKRAVAAATAAANVASDLKKNTDQMKGLRDALGNSKAAVPAAPGQLPDFLVIKLRQTEFDPIINRVLAQFRVKQNQNVDIAKFSKAIVERGLATNIGKVSQTLSRSRISETRRNILAAAYPALLKNQLGDPPKERVAGDTAGLAHNLLAELELVLDDFAKGVVDASEESLSLDLDPKAREALLVRVRKSI